MPETKNPAGNLAGQSKLGCPIVVDLSAAPLARRVTVMVEMMMASGQERHEAFSLQDARK
jgi:hypothetical protein